MMLAFIRNIGGPEVLIVLVIVLLLFGAAKLPQLARSLGASAKEFRKAHGSHRHPLLPCNTECCRSDLAVLRS